MNLNYTFYEVMSRHIYPFGLTFLLCISTACFTHAQDDPPGSPVGSYEDYFPYYTKGDATMPAGSDLVSDAVLLMDDGESFWTAFLINTDTDDPADRQICGCTARHNLENVAVGDRIEVDAYMKYLGRLKTGPDLDREVISSVKTTLHAKVVAMGPYTEEDNNVADWLIFKVDPDELPVEGYTTLGYSIDPAVYTATPPGKTFVISHPYGLDQRIADELTCFLEPLSSDFVLLKPVDGKVKPGGVGPGSSGAPVVSNNLPFPVATAILRSGVRPLQSVPEGNMTLEDQIQYIDGYLTYATYFRATKMSSPELKAAIIEHCRKKKDTIGSDSLYRTSVVVDNTQGVSEFMKNLSITSQAALEGAADQSYGAYNLNSMLLKAGTLTVNCLINNKAGKERLNCLAKTVVLEPLFEYLASGSNQLSINTITEEKVSAGKPSASSEELQHINYIASPELVVTEPGEFNVYPNPVGTGDALSISFPATAAGCSLVLKTIDNRPVYSLKNVGASSPYRLTIPGLSKGTYILTLEHQKTGEQLFTRKIICR